MDTQYDSTDESITTTKIPDPLQDITVTVVDAISGSIDQAVAEGIERIAAFEAANGPDKYVVYVTTRIQTVAKEGEFCRHVVLEGSATQAAREAILGCRLNNQGDVMIAEVFAHSGSEFRYAYRLVEVS